MATNKESNFISAVAYIHNNEDQILPFLKFLLNQLETNFKKYELILVNDYSTDDTISIIKKYCSNQNCGMVSVVNMSRFHGMEHAMQAGIDLAIGDFIFEFDSLLLDYEDSLFMEVYQKSLEGNDIVSAVPQNAGMFSSRLFYKVYNRFATTKGSKKLRRETFRLLSRRAVNRVKSLNHSIPYRKVLYQNCGLSTAYVIYESAEKNRSHFSKEVSENRRDLATDSLILFTDVVQKVSIFLSGAFVVITLAVGAFTVIDYFSVNKPVEGWAPIMGFLSLGFSGVFILLSIILKYLSVILNMVFSKQAYLIQSIDKLGR